MNKLKNGWEVITNKNSHELFARLDDPQYYGPEFQDEHPLIYKEQSIILDLLNLFINGEFCYYFNEVHDSPEPEDLENLDWKRLYYTPVDFYYKSGEYNSIDVAYTDGFTYYAISLHGSSFCSALTEYVRVPSK